MSPIRLVAEHHFRRTVFRRGYLLTLLSMPLFLAFVIGMSWVAASVEDDSYTVGVVDPGGFLKTTVVPGWDGDEVAVLRFESEAAALAALEAENDPVNGVFLLPADYPEDMAVELVVLGGLDFSARSYFAELLQTNLLEQNLPDLTERVLAGSDIVVRATESKREFPASNPTAGLFVPLMAAVIYVFTIFPITGIMVGALGEEKANRTVEVLITSISTRDLISGKILAVVGIALLQISAWSLFFAGAIWLGGNVLDITWLQNMTVPWRDVGVIALLALPGFLFFGAGLVLVGSLIDDAETLQQVGGFMTVPLFLPLYVLPAILETPDGTVAQIFSYLPFTNVLTIGFLSIFQEIPAWRIALSGGIALTSGLGLAWLAGRAFRIGMLRIGKRVRLKELFRRTNAEVKL